MLVAESARARACECVGMFVVVCVGVWGGAWAQVCGRGVVGRGREGVGALGIAVDVSMDVGAGVGVCSGVGVGVDTGIGAGM